MFNLANSSPLKTRLKIHEGNALFPYDDRGDISIGRGHNLTRRGIPLWISDALFDLDLNDAITEFYQLPDSFKSNLNSARASVIVELIFRLGFLGFMGFRRMRQAIEESNWQKAHDELLDSQMARKDREAGSNRSERLAKILLTGSWYVSV